MHDKHLTVLLGTFTGGLEFQNAQKLNILASDLILILATLR